MKIFNAIMCRGFTICYGFASPGEIVRHPNSLPNNTQNKFYMVDGNVHMTDGTNEVDMPLKQWYDLTSYKNSKVLTYTVGDKGCSWVLILPTPNEDEYNVELVENGVINADLNSMLLVTEGENVTFNNMKMKNLNYTILDKNITVAKNGGVVTKITKVV